MNGWFMHKVETDAGRSKFTNLPKRKLFNNNIDWPPPSNIKPIFISFHINNKDMLDECYIPYYKMNEPIGCRDRSTSKYLTDRGVDAYFSGCLTLTLDNMNKDCKEDTKYNVDFSFLNNLLASVKDSSKRSFILSSKSSESQLQDKSLLSSPFCSISSFENNFNLSKF